MGLFKDALTKMGEGIKDLSSLDVVTFEGSVQLEASDKVTTFDQVMSKATGNTDVKVKVLASTQTKIDGDIVAFYDKDITQEQMDAHAELIEAAEASRTGTIDFIKSIVGDIDPSGSAG